MFTMKKLALVGAAGLAALSMSCSDSGDESNPGGKIENLELGTASTGGVYPIKGIITAEGEANLVKSVTITATNGGDAQRSGNEAIDAETVTLESLGYKLVPNCSGANGKITLKVKATFADGDPAELDKEFDVKCTVVPTLPTGFDKTETITLGGPNSALGSFLDIDATPFAIYTQSQAGDKKNDIDLFFEGANFITPSYAPSTGLGSQVSGSTSVATLCKVASGTTLSNVDAVIDYFLDECSEEGEASVPVEANGSYIVFTSAENLALLKLQGDVTATITIVTGRAPLDL